MKKVLDLLALLVQKYKYGLVHKSTNTYWSAGWMKKVLVLYLLALLVQKYEYGLVQKYKYLLIRRLDEEGAQFTCFTSAKAQILSLLVQKYKY
jgi:hypothetical protein